jgi:chromatin remodeling complex protein RSC6
MMGFVPPTRTPPTATVTVRFRVMLAIYLQNKARLGGRLAQKKHGKSRKRTGADSIAPLFSIGDTADVSSYTTRCADNERARQRRWLIARLEVEPGFYNNGQGDTERNMKKRAGGTKNSAFMKPMQPSPQLAEIVGSKPLPRTEVTKKVWAHIKKQKLQNPNNKREIIADAKLEPVFGKKKLNMFEMTKAINKHLK